MIYVAKVRVFFETAKVFGAFLAEKFGGMKYLLYLCR